MCGENNDNKQGVKKKTESIKATQRVKTLENLHIQELPICLPHGHY